MKEKQLIKFSVDTGIPILKIKKALGIVLHSRSHATTLKEALIEYQTSPINSEEREVALIKVNKFLLLDIKHTSTKGQIKELYSMCPSGSEAETAAIIKMATFFK